MSSLIGLENKRNGNNKTKEDNAVHIAKEILREMDVAIKRANENLRLKEGRTYLDRHQQQFKREPNTVDDANGLTVNSLGVSQLERNEIARLAMKLRPCDYHLFVNEFGLTVEDETDATSVVRTLEVMLKEYLAAHPAREPGRKLLRLVRNVSNITFKSYFGKRRPKVNPMDCDNADQGERRINGADQVWNTSDSRKQEGSKGDPTDSDSEDDDDSEDDSDDDCEGNDDDYEYDSLDLGPNDLNILSLVPNESKYDNCLSRPF